MRISFFLLIALMLAACTAGYGFQATITVGSTGNATTIQQAFQMMGSTVMADSVTLYLGDAVYNEVELSLTQHNGYPKSVKIMGNPLGEPPTINFTQQNSNGTAITVTSIEAFTMTGVNVSLSQSAAWGAAVSVHLTAGQLKTPSSSSGISIYAPTATKGLDVDIEGGGSYTVSATTITTNGPCVVPGTGVSKLTLTGNTFTTGSKVIDGTNLRSDTVIVANNNITKTSNSTSPVLDIALTEGQNARYVWVHDNQVHLSDAAATAIDISSSAGGSIQVNNNLVTLGGYTSCDSRGLHISGFGGIGSTINITDDSISGGGVAIWLEGIKAGTAVTMDNLGLEASISGIMVGSNSYPATVTIGSTGPDASPVAGRWMPFGTDGYSKVRVRNNSRGMAPMTKPANPLVNSVSCPTGAGIDLTLASSSCAVAIHYTQIVWASTTAISCTGKFSGSITTDNNLIDLNGSNTGISISGFGGSGATLICDGDSVSNADVGIALDSIQTGTAVSLTNFGIRAITNGIAVPAGNHPSILTIGTSGGGLATSAGTPFGTRGSSRARVMNNARAMAPVAGRGNLPFSTASGSGAGIAIGITGGSCALTIEGTEVYWTGDGISVNGAISGTVSTADNLVDLTGTGNGIYINRAGGLGSTVQSNGDSINNAGTGICLDSIATGTATSLLNFGIRATNTGISVPAGNHPSTLTIGLSGGAIAGKENSPAGVNPSSRARIMNNARSMVPVAGRGNLPFGIESGSGPGIAIGITGGSCVLAIQGTEIFWVGDGISVDGHFTGTFHTSDNMVDLTGSGVGMHVADFGGVGSNIDLQGDSLGNTGTGILVDSAAAGTHITIQNFGISATTSAIAIPAGNMPSAITLGGSGSGSVVSGRSPFGTMGRSRGTARNNAATMQPRAGHSDLTLGTNDAPGAAIDLSPSAGSCAISIASTDVHWLSTTGVSIKGHFGGSISTSDNIIALSGGGTGMHVTGFGGVGSTLDMQNDSLANTGTGILVDSTASGTTTSIQNFGISAGISAIAIPAGNMQSSLTIGGSGSAALTSVRSPFGAMGRSRGTARNNAAAMAPMTKHGGLTFGTEDSPGPAIDVIISNPACAVTIASTDIQWVSTTGISVAGHSNSLVTTSDNVVTLGGAGTGIHFNGVGGTGGSITSSDDSLANTGYGIRLDGIVAGTAVSTVDFGINAEISAIVLPPGSHPASLTIGGSGSGGVTSARIPFGVMGRSRGTARNNAAMMKPGTGHGDPTLGVVTPGAAFDIAINDSTCPVTFSNTDIQWNGGHAFRMAEGKVQNVTISGNAITGNNATGYAALVMDSVSAEGIVISSNGVASYRMLEKMWGKTNGNYEMRMNHFTGGGDSVHLSGGNLLVQDNEWTCSDGCLAQISPSFWCGITDHFAVQPSTISSLGEKKLVSANGRQIQFSGNSFSHFAGSGLALTIDQQTGDTVRLVVSGNTFSGNSSTGFTFAVTGNAGNVLSHVTGNSFTLNGGTGFSAAGDATMFFDASGSSAVRTVAGAANPNNFSGNGGSGLEIGAGVTMPGGMHLQNFGSNGMFNFVNGSSSNIDVTGNWWGTADSAAIAASILDGSDSSGLGGSSFYPYQTEAIPTAAEITASVGLAQGWNIVSLPVVPSNLTKIVLFPASLSNAFSFNGTYQSQPALQPGKGYWLKMAAAGSQSVTGLERTSDTVDVVTGWNLVGSLSSAIASASIASIPGGIQTSQFYGYAAGYYSADSIRAGKGYWIKAASSGKLVLGTAAARMPAGNRIRIVPAAELPPPAPGAGDDIASNGNGGEEEASLATRELPKEFALRQNYPNPFNPSTAIQFDLPAASMVTLKVYNVLGQEVAAVLDAQPMDAGFRNVTFDASPLASGTYVYRIQAVRMDGDATSVFTSAKKMLLVR